MHDSATATVWPARERASATTSSRVEPSRLKSASPDPLGDPLHQRVGGPGVVRAGAHGHLELAGARADADAQAPPDVGIDPVDDARSGPTPGRPGGAGCARPGPARGRARPRRAPRGRAASHIDVSSHGGPGSTTTTTPSCTSAHPGAVPGGGSTRAPSGSVACFSCTARRTSSSTPDARVALRLHHRQRLGVEREAPPGGPRDGLHREVVVGRAEAARHADEVGARRRASARTAPAIASRPSPTISTRSTSTPRGSSERARIPALRSWIRRAGSRRR